MKSYDHKINFSKITRRQASIWDAIQEEKAIEDYKEIEKRDIDRKVKLKET
jgi:hypothetical protein